ncbi:EAL domain-containing protein [Sphingomonas psychrotolerans]|uniref:EAL domain-containing protein n=1 Tax=Sphingomonas psychrotolerans TaxID=1327635 RepID=UPI002277F4DD
MCSADFHGGKLVDHLSSIFVAAGVPLNKVVLEVTETVSMGDADQVVSRQIRAVRELGVRIALDDFGTGFASLTHLMTVPFDVLKIDKSFVDRLAGDSVSRAIVEGVLHIARELNVEVVAEGVESAEQAGLLAAAGCKLAQGYWFAAPVDVETATRLLARQNQQPAAKYDRAR